MRRAPVPETKERLTVTHLVPERLESAIRDYFVVQFHDDSQGVHTVKVYLSGMLGCDCHLNGDHSCDGRKVVRALRRANALPWGGGGR